MNIPGVSTIRKQTIQIYNMNIEISFWFKKNSKKVHDDIFLWWYCVQYGLGIFHTTNHKYINIIQMRAKKDSKSIYDSQARHSDIQYDHSNLIFIEKRDKNLYYDIYCDDIVYHLVKVYSILNTIRISILVS